MKYIFGLLSLFFFFRVENSRVQICKGIKNGTFITIDKRVGKTIIQRNDSIQLEQNETLGIKYLGTNDKKNRVLHTISFNNK